MLRFTETLEAIELDIVLVPTGHRKRGIGTFLVLRLLTLADAVGKPVRTTARPIGQRSPAILARLVAYYHRFGFEARERGVTTVKMERPARTPGPQAASPL
jgi:GNAT superfamily N-acetyltransferase